MALSLAFLFTSYSNSQAPASNWDGNLVGYNNQSTSITSTWHNAYYRGSDPLLCMKEGDPGYCGPLPSVSSWGQINFSYGLTDLYQVVNIRNSLPNSGTGLQVTGFNFSFFARNSGAWDDNARDTLSAYINIYNNKNSKLVESYNWDITAEGWRHYNLGKDFTNPHSAANLGNLQYGFVGKDNNNLVGPYGPEVTELFLSLKYSVDPCVTNPLHSPTCKGYLEALAKLKPVVEDITTPVTEEVALPKIESETTNTTKAKDNKPAPNLTNILSMMAGNQSRIDKEAKTVVQAAESASAKDALQAQEQAQSVAAIAATASQSNTITSTTGPLSNSSTQSQNSSGPMIGTSRTNVVEVLKQPTQPTLSVDNTTSSVVTVNNTYVPPTVENTVGSQTMNISSESSRYELFSARPTFNSTVEIETPQLEGIKFGTMSVLNDVIAERPVEQNTNTVEQKTESVNRNVQPNDLAGVVDIARMATQPAGYQAYSMMMPDVAFYAPKDFYRNQTVIDNARVQRSLNSASDRLHQRMVDQQYNNNKGN